MKQIEVMKAIRDGKPYTKANKVLAPMVANGFIECEYKGLRIISAKLTHWGNVILKHNDRRS